MTNSSLQDELSKLTSKVSKTIITCWQLARRKEFAQITGNLCQTVRILMKGNVLSELYTSVEIVNVLSQEMFQAKSFENVIAYYHVIVSFNFSFGSNYIGLRSICLSLKRVFCVNLMKDTSKQEPYYETKTIRSLQV